jgi:FkbM family methyltransferase
LANLHAFEGDERQIKKIKDSYGNNINIWEDFLFDGSEKTLYITSGPSGMTSLFKPKEDALNFFNGFKEFGKVEKTEQVQTRRLDSISDLPLIDFIKMDIQGAELTVLQNGIEKIKNCVAMQLEVSYINLYEQQPTFGEVDSWMRSQGFVPHCFLEVKRWSIAPTIFNNNFRVPGNQLLESDIVYIKDPLKLELLTTDQIKKFITISHHCFKSYDLCVYLFLELLKRNQAPLNVQQLYIAELGKKT